MTRLLLLAILICMKDYWALNAWTVNKSLRPQPTKTAGNELYSKTDEKTTDKTIKFGDMLLTMEQYLDLMSSGFENNKDPANEDGTTEKGCADSNELCSQWLDEERCTNPLYKSNMEKYCPRTCGFCSTTTTTTSTTTSPVNCHDSDHSCKAWATLGHCKGKFKMYMERNCQKSCKTCSEENSRSNRFDSCFIWAFAGLCDRTATSWLMSFVCPDSCDTC